MKDPALIHVFSGLAGGVGFGLAQLPSSDAPVIVSIQTTMIMALAERYAVEMSRTAAAELALTLAATMVGRSASQVLVGWIPGMGNLLNAATAASITEAVGWAAVRWFQRSEREEALCV